jgi:enoyl-CoA hydratase/carnithine racemase
MPHAPLQHQLSDGVLTLTLNRPHKRNAINNDLLCGSGLAFCAGRDVSEPPTDTDLELTQQVACALVACRKPVVVWGLVWKVVPTDDLSATALQAAKRLAALDPTVVGHFKRVLNTGGAPGFAEAIRLESDVQRDLMAR